ncbi:UDP-glucose:(galactosyl) LPS alpha-1,2-glucosyltransferase [Citrobacter freundii]|nr:UDP-glucose:(galactosyl) LPS alpha-1,2-glucosyltransferase [Citrobacter freundii]
MDNNSVINIAYCTDANYLEYVSTSIISVLMNNPHQTLSFYVFVYDVSDEDIAKLKLTSNFIHVIRIEKEEIEKYDSNFTIKHLNRSIYMRLIAPRLLKGKVDKFIYLDADTLCFDDISSINEIDISNVICAVCHDSINGKESKDAHRLGLNSENYFNSGFLYINVDNWIQYDIENKSNIILLEKGNTLKYPDQDALNITMDGRVKFIENHWNFLFTWFTDDEKEKFFYFHKRTAKIIHFTGSRKPWYKEHSGLAQQTYVLYRNLTPWRNTPLLSYSSRMRPTDYRVYARQSAKKGKYISFLKWYLKYLKSKFNSKSKKI